MSGWMDGMMMSFIFSKLRTSTKMNLDRVLHQFDFSRFQFNRIWHQQLSPHSWRERSNLCIIYTVYILAYIRMRNVTVVLAFSSYSSSSSASVVVYVCVCVFNDGIVKNRAVSSHRIFSFQFAPHFSLLLSSFLSFCVSEYQHIRCSSWARLSSPKIIITFRHSFAYK